MVNSEVQVKPKFALVKLDETAHWSADVQEKVGRIFGVYLVDLNSATHCCEITPSYELHFVESQWTNEIPEDESERFHDLIEENDSPRNEIKYMHCHSVDAFPEIAGLDLPEGAGGIKVLAEWNSTVDNWYDAETFDWFDLIIEVAGE